MLVPHGWPKLMAGPAAVAAGTMTRRGIEPAYTAACIAIVLETRRRGLHHARAS